jgi:transcriptional regulator with XRE-family HTH domain
MEQEKRVSLPDLQKTFGQHLRHLRRVQFNNAAEFASRLNLPKTTYYTYEQGKSFPDLATFIGITEVLRIDFNHLFEPFLLSDFKDEEFRHFLHLVRSIRMDPEFWGHLYSAIKLVTLGLESKQRMKEKDGRTGTG